MNWLRKISEQADQMVGTLDSTLQQPVTDAMVFKPLYQTDLNTDGASATTISEPSTEPCPPSGGETVYQDGVRDSQPGYAPRLKPA